jgi:hypothetical protein
MKLPLATWSPGPGRFAYMLALPTIAPSSPIATVVRPGGRSIHISRAASSPIAGS